MHTLIEKHYKQFLIRSWKPDDRQPVALLTKQVLGEFGMLFAPDSNDWDAVQIEQAYWQTGGIFWVVEEQGMIVGSGGYYPCDRASTPNDRGAELRKMLLLPQTRGQGLGSYLLEALEQSAVSHSFTEMWLETATQMQAAIKMYERHGYRQLEHGDIHVQRCDRLYVKTLRF